MNASRSLRVPTDMSQCSNSIKRQMILNRSRPGPTLSDFVQKRNDDETAQSTCIQTNDSELKPDLKQETSSLFERTIRELRKEVIDALDMRLNKFENGQILRKQEARLKKKNDRVIYVGDDIYPIFKLFMADPHEPLKETLRRVAKAAQKHLELTGGSKPN